MEDVGHITDSNTILSGKLPGPPTVIQATPLAPPTSENNTKLKISIKRPSLHHGVQRYDDDQETSVTQQRPYSPPISRHIKFKTDLPARERKYHTLSNQCEGSPPKTQQTALLMTIPSSAQAKIGFSGKEQKVKQTQDEYEAKVNKASLPVTDMAIKTPDVSPSSPKKTTLFDMMGVKKLDELASVTKPIAINKEKQMKRAIKSFSSDQSCPSSPDVTPHSSPKQQHHGLLGWLFSSHNQKSPGTTDTSNKTEKSWFKFDGFFGHQETKQKPLDSTDGASSSVDYPVPHKQGAFHQKEDHRFFMATQGKTEQPTATPSNQKSYMQKKVPMNNSDINAFAPQTM